MFNKSPEEISKKYGMNNNSGQWMKLKEGENRIKIVSDFEDYGIHYIPAEKKSYICIGRENGCPYCAKGLTPTAQFMGYVIDRADNRVKLLHVGWTIYKAISDLQASVDYGFDGLPPYDIIINKTGSGIDTQYTVMPSRKDTPLTEEEKEMVKRYTKTSVKEILDKMKSKITPVKIDNNGEVEPAADDDLPTLTEN